MLLERFYDDLLAQASYLVGCQRTKEAIVLDPLRDATPAREAARRHGLRITHVAETHIHADYVSGARELARRTGARLHLSGEGGPEWSYRFADEEGAVILRDGDQFAVGNLRFDVLHTPGHTPEHIVFVVTDRAGADRPMGAFTGDFLFVGDVGRPDLLERAARMGGTMERGARDLFRSLQRFAELDDWLQIWPGHGAGSACGKGLGAVPSSTLGYERRFNWAFQHREEDAFVEAVLAGQPDAPHYFAEMKRINRDGPPVLGRLPEPPLLDDEALVDRMEAGALVVDTRPRAAFAGGHVAGTLGIPLTRSFVTWAGWLLPYDRDLYLIAEDADAGRRAARHLWVIGLDRVHGVFRPSAIARWARGGGAIQKIDDLSPGELQDRLQTGEEVAVLDVRWQDEWDADRIPGSIHIPLGHLAERLDELPSGRPIVTACSGGGRSAIAAGLLQAHGVSEVANLVDGIDRWREEGYPMESEEPGAREEGAASRALAGPDAPGPLPSP